MLTADSIDVLKIAITQSESAAGRLALLSSCVVLLNRNLWRQRDSLKIWIILNSCYECICIQFVFTVLYAYLRQKCARRCEQSRAADCERHAGSCAPSDSGARISCSGARASYTIRYNTIRCFAFINIQVIYCKFVVFDFHCCLRSNRMKRISNRIEFPIHADADT